MKTLHVCGFSLVELMVVLAIISILSALAMPAYNAYLTRARRAEGRVALMQVMQQQERYFSQANTYSTFNADSRDPIEAQFRWWSGISATDSYYELAGAPCDGELIKNCVKLTATPGTGKVRTGFRDSACGTLTMTSTGVHEPAQPPECWR